MESIGSTVLVVSAFGSLAAACGGGDPLAGTWTATATMTTTITGVLPEPAPTTSAGTMTITRDGDAGMYVLEVPWRFDGTTGDAGADAGSSPLDTCRITAALSGEVLNLRAGAGCLWAQPMSGGTLLLTSGSGTLHGGTLHVDMIWSLGGLYHGVTVSGQTAVALDATR